MALILSIETMHEVLENRGRLACVHHPISELISFDEFLPDTWSKREPLALSYALYFHLCQPSVRITHVYYVRHSQSVD